MGSIRIRLTPADNLKYSKRPGMLGTFMMLHDKGLPADAQVEMLEYTQKQGGGVDPMHDVIVRITHKDIKDDGSC